MIDEVLTPQEMERLHVLLTNPLHFPDAFKDYITERVRTQVGNKLPIEQARHSRALFADTVTVGLKTTSANGVWEDKDASAIITVPGPGKAMVFWDATYNDLGGGGTDTGICAISLNNNTPDANEGIWLRGALNQSTGARAQLLDLPSVSNTLKVQVFKFGTATGTWFSSALLVFRIEL